MSETRNHYGFPTAASLAEKFPPRAGEEVVIRTVADLRRYLDGLPDDFLVEGPGTSNALGVVVLPRARQQPAGLVYVRPVTVANRDGRGWQ